MSYEIIRSIVIKNDRVILRSSSNNVSPKHFDPWECASLTRILREQGQEALDIEILKSYENGNFQRGDNRWTRALERLRNMPEYPVFDWRAPDFEAVEARRKTPEFIELVKKALHSDFPAEKFVLATHDGLLHPMYFCKVGRVARFAFQKDKAKVFHYRREAEMTRLNYRGGSEWEVVPA